MRVVEIVLVESAHLVNGQIHGRPLTRAGLIAPDVPLRLSQIAVRSVVLMERGDVDEGVGIPLELYIGRDGQRMLVARDTVRAAKHGTAFAWNCFIQDALRFEAGDYVLSLRHQDQDIGEGHFHAVVARGRARAHLGTFLQDEQRVDPDGTHHLKARLPFTLTFEGGTLFGGEHIVRIQTQQGKTFDQDRLILTLDAGYERLRRIPDFALGVQKCYDRLASSLFGGSLPPGVTMTNNLTLGVTCEPVEFELPGAGAGGW